jgi:HPt (histidine-containing phosphotransfer) domain-containing protein
LRAVQDTFLQDMPGQIEAVHELVGRGETRLAGAQAHKIKGAAGNVGGDALRAVAAAMEQAAQQGDEAALKARLPELRRQFDLLQEAMRRNGHRGSGGEGQGEELAG